MIALDKSGMAVITIRIHPDELYSFYLANIHVMQDMFSGDRTQRGLEGACTLLSILEHYLPDQVEFSKNMEKMSTL